MMGPPLMMSPTTSALPRPPQRSCLRWSYLTCQLPQRFCLRWFCLQCRPPLGSCRHRLCRRHCPTWGSCRRWICHNDVRLKGPAAAGSAYDVTLSWSTEGGFCHVSSCPREGLHAKFLHCLRKEWFSPLPYTTPALVHSLHFPSVIQ